MDFENNTEMEPEVYTESGSGRNYRAIILLVLALIIVGVVVYFVLNKKDDTVNAALVNNSNKSSIDLVQLSDEQGATSVDYVDFIVNTITEDKRIYYEVVLLPKSTNTMDTTNINTYLTDQSNNKITGVVRYNDLPDAENGKILYKGVTKLGNENEILKDSKDFRLRMWLDSNSTETSGLFEFDIDINTYYVENDFVIKGSAPLTLKVDNGNVLTGEKAMTNIITISDGALSCVSSDETIATCSVSGKALVIDGLKEGEAKITINQAAGSVYSVPGSTVFTISVATSKQPSILSLSAESGTIYLGTDVVLAIDTTGDGILSCVSSDEKVATCTIDEKKLTIKGVADGNATITVSQAEGETMLAPADAVYTVEGVRIPAAKTISAVSGLETVPYGKIYTGEDPDNYIWFNNEQWRILGVYGDLLKIIRAVPYTSGQVYNSSDKTGNTWDGSEVQKYLYSNYESIIADEKSRAMVLETANWNIGAANPQATASEAYENAIKAQWKGKVGLITSYEYQYASPQSCWTKKGNNYETCGKENWIYNIVMSDGNKVGGWTMTPHTKSSRALRVHQDRFVDDNPVSASSSLSPVVYLKSTISITGGTGKAGAEGSYKIG